MQVQHEYAHWLRMKKKYNYTYIYIYHKKNILLKSIYFSSKLFNKNFDILVSIEFGILYIYIHSFFIFLGINVWTMV